MFFDPPQTIFGETKGNGEEVWEGKCGVSQGESGEILEKILGNFGLEWAWRAFYWVEREGRWEGKFY